MSLNLNLSPMLTFYFSWNEHIFASPGKLSPCANLSLTLSSFLLSNFFSAKELKKRRKRVNRGDRARVKGIRWAVGMDGPAWAGSLLSPSNFLAAKK